MIRLKVRGTLSRWLKDMDPCRPWTVGGWIQLNVHPDEDTVGDHHLGESMLVVTSLGKDLAVYEIEWIHRIHHLTIQGQPKHFNSLKNSQKYAKVRYGHDGFVFWVMSRLSSHWVLYPYHHILKNGMLHRWNEGQWQRKCRIWNGPRCSSPIPGMVELWKSVEYQWANDWFNGETHSDTASDLLIHPFEKRWCLTDLKTGKSMGWSGANSEGCPGLRFDPLTHVPQVESTNLLERKVWLTKIDSKSILFLRRDIYIYTSPSLGFFSKH